MGIDHLESLDPLHHNGIVGVKDGFERGRLSWEKQHHLVY
jgi:hypothetical protein